MSRLLIRLDIIEMSSIHCQCQIKCNLKQIKVKLLTFWTFWTFWKFIDNPEVICVARHASRVSWSRADQMGLLNNCNVSASICVSAYISVYDYDNVSPPISLNMIMCLRLYDNVSHLRSWPAQTRTCPRSCWTAASCRCRGGSWCARTWIRTGWVNMLQNLSLNV